MLKHVKQIIRKKLWNVWRDEWSSLSTNSCAKACFLAIWSTKALLNLRTNATTTQIITSHCFLNSNQHRFSFSSTSSCPCGAPVESILHLIFHCPIFSSLSSHTEQSSMERVSRFCLSNQAPSQKTRAVSAGHELFIKIGHLNLSTSFLSGYAVGLQ